MIKKVFIDSDVILDVATGRTPFVKDSQRVLSIIETGKATGLISANSVTNIYYILSKISTPEKSVLFIKNILKFISVISIDHDGVLKAIDSKFTDFEDGVQNYCALKNQCDFIVTRNIKDYKFSELTVLEPKEFLLLFN
ncbi:MAG: PIN domain-containing protein [Deltaproteobacteria bacterium]|nr:PIN domain-containing protein [Deltaproteobacteria bacterium]